MVSFKCYYQNPLGFCFLGQIRAFEILTSLGLPNLNMKEKRIEFCLVLLVKKRHHRLLWTASDNVCACVRLSVKNFSVDGIPYFLNGRKLIWSTFKVDFNCIPDSQQTFITDWILWLSHVEFSCMVEGPFSRLIFLSLAARWSR